MHHDVEDGSVESLEASLSGSDSDGNAKATEESEVTSKRSLFTNWPLMASITVYCIFSLHDTAYAEVILS